METSVTRGIVQSFTEAFLGRISLDAAIVGSGPSGLEAARRLARAGKKVAVYESRLAPGGGMWGGAMLFNRIALVADGLSVMEELGVPCLPGPEGVYLADSIHATAALIAAAASAGVAIFNGMRAEDLVVKGGRVAGLVLNWASIEREGLPVDPLAILARVVIDATGHPAEMVGLLRRKNGLGGESGASAIPGERSLDMAEGEAATVACTREVHPGLIVCGMAANAVAGRPRMGPVFGGMLLSGRKAAELALEALHD